MGRNAHWVNSDGLAVGFGTRTPEVNAGAKVNLGGKRQQVIVKIVGASVPDSDVAAQLYNAVEIPANALLESAKLFVTTAFVGATAVLDIGVYNASTGAAVNDAGIDAAVATATLVDNAVVACDGALIGTVLAQRSKIGVSYDTAPFTDGEATLVVEYIY